MDRSKDSNPESTLELVRRAQGNDRQAFDRLAEMYRSRLRFLARSRLGQDLGQRVEVEDVLQETFMRAFESIQNFQWRSKGSFYSWLCSIAEHVLQDFARIHLHTRRKKGGKEIFLATDSSHHGKGDLMELACLPRAGGTSPSKAMQRNERFERLEKALNSLTKDHREVILLARVHCLPVKEIAERMGRSPDAVSMLLLRAVRQLRKLFGDTGSLSLPPRSLEALPEVTPHEACRPPMAERPPDSPLFSPLDPPEGKAKAQNGKEFSGLRTETERWNGVGRRHDYGRDSDILPPP